MIYLLILIYSLTLSFVYDFGNLRIGKKMNLLIVFMVLVSLSGFRYRIGGDSYFYIKMYEYLPTLPELSSIELGVSKLQPLWLLLNAISRTISPDFFVFQLLHALIVNSIIFYFFRKYTKYVFTAVLLYFIGFYGYFNFEILRESLAICVFLLSLEFFVKKNGCDTTSLCLLRLDFIIRLYYYLYFHS